VSVTITVLTGASPEPGGALEGRGFSPAAVRPNTFNSLSWVRRHGGAEAPPFRGRKRKKGRPTSAGPGDQV